MEENEERGLYRKDKTTNKPPLGKYYLLIIGINAYQHIKKLNYAVSDVLAVKDLLIKSYHFEEETTFTLLDEQATRNNIIQKFKTLVGRLEENDNLLIYYAGHGHYDDILDMGYWIPVEGNQEEIGTYIPNSDIINSISRVKAKHIFLVSDSCFSGTLLAETRDAHTERVRHFPSRWGLCSGRKELVLDKSFFAQSFIDFLRENKAEELLVGDLVRYVAKSTANNTEQTPFGGQIKNVGDKGGEFVFYLKANESEIEQSDFEKLQTAYFTENKSLPFVQQLIHSLDDFLEKYPKSTHKREVKAWLKDIEDEKEWQIACQDNKIYAYREYIDNNSDGKYLVQAKQKIEEIKKKETIIFEKSKIQEPKKEPIIKTTPQNPLIIPLTDKINIEMVYVEGGTFEMGYKAGRDGENNDNMIHAIPLHQVTLDSFHIGKFTITQAQYQAIMGKNPSDFKGNKLPVEQVSWEDTQGFIKKLNEKTGKKFRLPTEAEWEYAARGGNKSKGFMYAGSNNIDEVAWFDKNSGNKTHEVGLKKPNELGIYDMSGNLWEWCEDYWDAKFYEKSASTKNPISENNATYHIIRGGSWGDDDRNSRLAIRDWFHLHRSDYYGFRVCL